MNKLITFALVAGLSLGSVGCTVMQTPAPANENMPDNIYVVGRSQSGYFNFGHDRSGGRGVHVGYPPGRETRILDPRDVMSRGQYSDGTKYWSTDPPRKKGGNKKHR